MEVKQLDEESNLKKCSIGEHGNGECHKSSQCKSQGFHGFNDLDSESQILISRRSGIESSLIKCVCYHHHAILLRKYSDYQKKCCNPFQKHTKSVSGQLKIISIQEAILLFHKTKQDVKPGQKLCRNCCLILDELKTSSPASQSSTSTDTLEFDSMEICQASTSKIEDLNETLSLINTSPLKLHGITKHQRSTYAKRKVQEAVEEIKIKVAKALNVPEDVCDPKNASDDDFQSLINEIKLKVDSSPQFEKCKLLTLVPFSWSISQIRDKFHVSEYTAKKSRQLKLEYGILPDISKKKGHSVNNETINEIISFYEDDEISRMCPGKKEFVSVRVDGVKIQKQKRLLLANIREIYIQFKERNPDLKVGFSKFCELRPKWCVTVASRGIHSVCVCEIHQNLKLKTTAFPRRETYKDVMLQYVCSTEKRKCMLQRCEDCPGKEHFITYLESLFTEDGIDQDDKVSFKQWLNQNGQTRLQELTQSVSEFIEDLSNSIQKILEHHFVAKSQALYLRKLKENLPRNHAITLMDFAENFSFVVQDAVQGFHWETTQATIHPFVTYYLCDTDNSLKCISCCIVSDETDHGATTVHYFLKMFLEFLKTTVPNLEHIHYFSDGAASQYKNCKNLLNLCYHQMDFNLTAEWNFFATSHGKSPCDGIGGTVKRLVTRASLQQTINNQILTPIQFFQWASKNISSVKFIYVAKGDVGKHKDAISERLSLASTIVGTRSHHKFIPLTTTEISMYRLSLDEFSTAVKVVSSASKSMGISFEDISVGQYVAAVYDKEWYVAQVEQKIYEENDFQLNFMKHLENPFSLQWPKKEDKCFVPLQNILCLLSNPKSIGMTQMFHLKKTEEKKIKERFASFIKRYVL